MGKIQKFRRNMISLKNLTQNIKYYFIFYPTTKRTGIYYLYLIEKPFIIEIQGNDL